jgi:hypothetical protein
MVVVIPYLMGGLGNWLFQVAAVTLWGKDHSVILSHKHSHRSPHSSTDYFSTILRKFEQGNVVVPLNQINEPPKLRALLPEPIHIRENTLFVGYFHNWNYVPPGFRDMLTFENPALLVKYPKLSESCFLHVRGGDYVGHWLHDIGLAKRYYPSTIQLMKEKGITRFSVFTNDREYCKKQEYLKGIDYEIIDENELDTLYLMTQCRAGITANSSFSWWGAYLNPNRPLCLPSRWFNDLEFTLDGYFFPGCYIHNV